MSKRNLNHVTPFYIVQRARVWLQSKRHPEWPWLTGKAVKWCESYLKPHHNMVEWGGGRSTIWFAKRVQKITTCETSQKWAEQIKQQAAAANLTNIELIVENPRESEPAKARLLLAHLPDESVDFCLVDGSYYRLECMLAAIRLVKKGGYIMLDNAERYLATPYWSKTPYGTKETPDEWQRIESLLANWPCVWTSNTVCDTVWWQKP
jgi:hypothetical protein